MFTLLLIFVIFLLLIVLPFVLVRLIPPTEAKEKGNYLLVIAHPDDECLFFAPTLLSIRSNSYLLCLSNGNNHRANELARSCEKLGIKEYRIIDDQIHLKDDQSKTWLTEAILPHVEHSVRRWNISTIISFDSYGISGHRNHSSIYFALLELKSRPISINFLSLQSVPIYRKYLTAIEIIRLSFRSSSSTQSILTFVLSIDQCFKPHQAMFEHQSQLVWFRYLYLAFSRYIWINDLKLIY